MISCLSLFIPNALTNAVISMPREGVDGGEDSVSKFKTISRKSIAASQSSLHRSETVMGGLDGWRGELDCFVFLLLINFI